ncbi:MAG: glycosyltransferase family A protein [Candidatus Bathyarchaeia archaeon]
MPVNGVQTFLPQAIESILNQTLQDFELLVITESGTNAEKIETYSDKFIRHIETNPKLGLVGCLNQGIDLFRGEYVALGAAELFSD